VAEHAALISPGSEGRGQGKQPGQQRGGALIGALAAVPQPSPVEQILDKEEFTLEELLDEEDIIQECKSLNGRLVAL
jgi:hypothetical protein